MNGRLPPCLYMFVIFSHLSKLKGLCRAGFTSTLLGEVFALQLRTLSGKSVAMGPKKRKDTKSKGAEENGASAEKKPKLAKKQSSRTSIPDVSGFNFASDAKTSGGKTWNKKFASWNINGIRAWLEKNGQSYITHEKPDVICVQETKCDKEKLPDEVNLEGYHAYWLSGDTEGYSGVGMYTKEKPINVSYGIEQAKLDNEGRVITAEFDKYYVVTAYIPNSGRGLPRLEYRTKEWDPAFRAYLKSLDEKKPVIMCGDLNVAHLEIDLKNPKSNKNKTAGFTDAERDEFGKLLEEGFVDSFRHLYPDKDEVYSYWSYMMNCRAKNTGWRLDYFVISERLKDNLCDSLMRSDVMGSDHCPIVCLMNFE